MWLLNAKSFEERIQYVEYVEEAKINVANLRNGENEQRTVSKRRNEETVAWKSIDGKKQR